MKTDKDLHKEMINSFIEAHPELQFITNNQLHLLLNAKSIEYASVAIEFAIKWLKDEEALKKGVKVPQNLKFKLKDVIYVQTESDEKNEQ